MLGTLVVKGLKSTESEEKDDSDVDFFLQFHLVFSSVAIVIKATNKLGIFQYLRILELP